MRLLRNVSVTALCVAALLLARPAHPIPTTTTVGTVIVGGGVVLVLYLMKVGPFEEKDAGAKHVQLTRAEAEQLAGAYLRELGPSLTEAVATGRGPLINDWARTLKLPPGHDEALGAVIYQNRVQLLELARADQLTDARAARFFETLSTLVNANPVLRDDLEALRASAG